MRRADLSRGSARRARHPSKQPQVRHQAHVIRRVRLWCRRRCSRSPCRWSTRSPRAAPPTEVPVTATPTHAEWSSVFVTVVPTASTTRTPAPPAAQPQTNGRRHIASQLAITRTKARRVAHRIQQRLVADIKLPDERMGHHPHAAPRSKPKTTSTNRDQSDDNSVKAAAAAGCSASLPASRISSAVIVRAIGNAS